MEGWARFALFLKFSLESEKAKAVLRFVGIAIGSRHGAEEREDEIWARKKIIYGRNWCIWVDRVWRKYGNTDGSGR